MSNECITELNGYLRDMAIAGYVPVAETLRGIAARHGVKLDESTVKHFSTYQSTRTK